MKKFFIFGGMPEAVVTLLEQQDIEKTQQVLQNIINAYALDFSKYAENKDVPKINHLWTSIPSQLARDNKKFLYQRIRSGARSREYEDALLWLSQAGLVHRIFKITKPGCLFLLMMTFLHLNFIYLMWVCCADFPYLIPLPSEKGTVYSPNLKVR